MGIITRATVKRSNLQNNTISNINTRRGYFLYFDTVGANPLEGFGTFEEGNNNQPSGNNNNNNPLSPSLLPLSGFEEGLGGGFNSPPGGNAEGLDLNVAALVNALTGANLEINHVEKESNHVKPIEFKETEAENSNEWLE